MKISIITVSYNSASTIKDTIESVLNQNFSEIEYIIIDGGSTDSTLDIVKSYGKKISKLISEKDNGIYDAMNKGLGLATGDVVGILNADDVFYDFSVLSEVCEKIELGFDAVYGDIVYVDKDNLNKIIRYWKPGEYSPGSFSFGWHPPHPSLFVKNKVYEKYGVFDVDFHISADFEIMLRFFEKYRIKSKYISKIFVKMRVGGESNRSLINIIKGNINCYKAFLKNNIKVNVFYPFFRLLPKILQFFYRN